MLPAIHIPHASRLTDHVAMIWQVEGVHQAFETIIPQGVVDIIFNFSEAIAATNPLEKTIFHAPRCFLFGLHTQLMHTQYSSRHLLLGVRIHPYRVRDLLGVHPAEIKNLTIDLSLLLPEMDRLWHQLGEKKTFEERIRVLEDEFHTLPMDIISAQGPCQTFSCRMGWEVFCLLMNYRGRSVIRPGNFSVWPTICSAFLQRSLHYLKNLSGL